MGWNSHYSHESMVLDAATLHDGYTNIILYLKASQLYR
jgi:hypothetical protein